MKKTLIGAITTALVVGAASTTFAAANPFSDVSSDHWAYDAVTQLAADGVIEGYGDGTYRGQRNITRYEMAQMIAKAMAKGDVGATDKALIDRLAAEFSDELNSLGVRVSNLEKHADMVKWQGEMRYTYQSNRWETAPGTSNYRNNVNENLLRLEPTAEVNDHWHINARLDASVDMSKDSSTQVRLQRAWAEGKYGRFVAKIGTFPDLTSYDRNMMFFNEMSGVELNFGNVLQAQIRAARLNTSDNNRYDDSLAANRLAVLNNTARQGRGFNANDTMNFQSIALTYKPGKFSFTGAYYHFNSDIFRNAAYSRSMDKDDAHIWEVASSYRFDKNVGLTAAYLRNKDADFFNHSHVIHLDYKGSKKNDKGSWGAYVSYRYQGANVSIDGANDGAMYNTKGWEIGAQYTLMKNVQIKGIYFNGKKLEDDRKAEKLFGRVELFF